MEGGIVMKGKEILKHQRGMTLVETVAVLVVIGFLSLLILSLLTKSVDHYDVQLTENHQLSDISYVFKIITKEIRKTTANNIQPITNGIKIDNVNYQLDKSNHTIYKFNGAPNTFTTNDEILAKQIDTFTVNQNNNTWHISIKKLDSNKELSTTIVSRSED